MAGTRKFALSVMEFSHLVSESLDIPHPVPCSQSFVENISVFSETHRKTRSRPSFQRIFSRPAPELHEDMPQIPPEDLSEAPRKIVGWPFSRSPRKDPPTANEANDLDACPSTSTSTSTSPYSISSPAATSTSSLGSLVPAHERLFQLSSRDSDEPSHCHEFINIATSSLVTITPPHSCEPSTALSHHAAVAQLDVILGTGSVVHVAAGSNERTVEPATGTTSRPGSIAGASFTSSKASLSVVSSESGGFDEDPTPRASTFGPQATLLPVETRNEASAQRGRLQHLSSSRHARTFALRPVVGAIPHAPSESESSLSVCSTSSLTSPVARSPSPTFPATRPSEADTSSPRVSPFASPYVRVSGNLTGVSSPSYMESTPVGFSPRQRKRALSRSLTPPPFPRPPPTGPLPAVPSSVPPVPPLPPLLSKLSMNMKPNAVISSPPRSTSAAIPINPATASPPSPPGGLRLPSRLSWVNSVRAVLPSPPASPTKPLRPLSGKTSLPITPTKTEKKRSNELKRPTSIGVIEAADNVQVRRTKSILLLGSRSKSNASLGTKRVQIHADVNLDPNPTPKPRRKSSAATVSGHPIFSSDSGSRLTSAQSAELLVLRERRHSAPVLSSMESRASGASLDWTLSLPFCTDTPGNKLLSSPLLTPEGDVEAVQGEDWTLCMPLKVRVDTATIESTDGPDSECHVATDATETVDETRPAIMQLPTPGPSPTWPTPASLVRPLDLEEEDELVPEERPASPASLGPHVGGLDLAGGHGKRASGWHVYGWFDDVRIPEDDEVESEAVSPTTTTTTTASSGTLVKVKSHVAFFRKLHDAGRHPSQDSMSTVSTSGGTTFYSARSSLVVN